MTQAFDVAAFRAAIQAVGNQQPKPITVPGVGKCFKREVSVADVTEAQALRKELAGQLPGLGERRLGIAIGLAQTLCGPDGTPVFDATSPDDVAMLAKVPWAKVRGVSADDEDDEEKNA